MDSDYRIDVSDVNRNIDLVDVIAMYFPLLRKTLLMDLRTNDVDGPMIRVVPMANTPEERFQSAAGRLCPGPGTASGVPVSGLLTMSSIEETRYASRSGKSSQPPAACQKSSGGP